MFRRAVKAGSFCTLLLLAIPFFPVIVIGALTLSPLILLSFLTQDGVKQQPRQHTGQLSPPHFQKSTMPVGLALPPQDRVAMTSAEAGSTVQELPADIVDLAQRPAVEDNEVLLFKQEYPHTFSQLSEDEEGDNWSEEENPSEGPSARLSSRGLIGDVDDLKDDVMLLALTSGVDVARDKPLNTEGDLERATDELLAICGMESPMSPPGTPQRERVGSKVKELKGMVGVA